MIKKKKSIFVLFFERHHLKLSSFIFISQSSQHDWAPPTAPLKKIMLLLDHAANPSTSTLGALSDLVTTATILPQVLIFHCHTTASLPITTTVSLQFNRGKSKVSHNKHASNHIISELKQTPRSKMNFWTPKNKSTIIACLDPYSGVGERK